MLLTESEAALMKCPVGDYCTGKRCMAWRCVPGKEFREFSRGTVIERVLIKDGPDRGYCGLAGRPE